MTQPRHVLIRCAAAASLIFSLSACSVTETVSNFLSSTSGKSWFTEDGLIKTDHRVQAFMAFNFENIKQDMAKGQGEYLDSLSTLMEIPPDRRASFYAHAQSAYPFVVQHRSSPQETLVQLVGGEKAATLWQ
ncbi:MAG TPA: DUF3015 family protein [Nitrospira sp.]|nr:DUF3015 family protein [Nitrospira sp.]